jgi:hypothetical protein
MNHPQLIPGNPFARAIEPPEPKARGMYETRDIPTTMLANELDKLETLGWKFKGIVTSHGGNVTVLLRRENPDMKTFVQREGR